MVLRCQTSGSGQPNGSDSREDFTERPNLDHVSTLLGRVELGTATKSIEWPFCIVLDSSRRRGALNDPADRVPIPWAWKMTLRPESRHSAEDREVPVVFVDLDGTLIRTDLLWEGLRLLLKTQRRALFLEAPLWLLRGKAAFKAELAQRAFPDPAELPYRQEVLEYLSAKKAEGHRLVLASASPSSWVHRVAEQTALFDHVLASSPEENLSGERKLSAIRDLIEEAPFEYIGNSRHDVPIWSKADLATGVAPTRTARRGLAPHPQSQILEIEEPSIWEKYALAFRPHQWVKNALLFVPLTLAHQLDDASKLLSTFSLFLAFCAVASAGYIVNDLMDIEDDRRHPTKSKRPLAMGTLSIPNALGAFVALLIFAALASYWLLPPAAASMTAGYFFLTLLYSLYLKEQLVADVFVLAGLYTYRVLAGGVAAEVEVSPWLLAFSTFFFFSLALIKRYTELLTCSEVDQPQDPSRRAYRYDDLPLVGSMGVAASTIAVLVLCLFVSSESVSLLYARPLILWLIPPIMYYWITRMWMLAHRGQVDADPVLFAVKDPTSLITGILLALVVWSAAA